MGKFGSGPSQGSRFGRAIGLLAAQVRAVGDRLFQEEDDHAHRHGWQIEVRHGGLSRTYRDPRFDQLQGCPACDGTGMSQPNLACDACSGTGRIRLGEMADPNAGRAR
jgi:RecJ-like exonuclease